MRLSERLLRRFPRRRSKRWERFKRLGSWIFVAGVGSFVLLLLGQFVARMWITPPVSSEIERTDLLVTKGQRIQLNVMNGSGEANLARVFTDFLRDRKFDVVEMGNFQNQDVERTFIIDKLSDTVAARKVAYALGIEEDRIVHEVDSSAFVDAAVVIGKDFQSLRPMK